MSIRKLKIYISLHFTTSEAVTSLMENQADGKKRTNKCTLRSVFKGTLASHVIKKMLYFV